MKPNKFLDVWRRYAGTPMRQPEQMPGTPANPQPKIVAKGTRAQKEKALKELAGQLVEAGIATAEETATWAATMATWPDEKIDSTIKGLWALLKDVKPAAESPVQLPGKKFLMDKVHIKFG
jgi:hypothetical protein